MSLVEHNLSKRNLKSTYEEYIEVIEIVTNISNIKNYLEERMIDLRKVKEYCESFDNCCENKGKMCLFFHDENGCMLKDAPTYIDIENVEKIYNELFNKKTKCGKCGEEVEIIDNSCPNCKRIENFLKRININLS